MSQRGVLNVRLALGLVSGLKLGLGLEELFVFDSKSENRDRASWSGFI